MADLLLIDSSSILLINGSGDGLIIDSASVFGGQGGSPAKRHKKLTGLARQIRDEDEAFEKWLHGFLGNL